MSELRIITYHYVRDTEQSDFPGIKAISTEEFRKQIEWISKTGEVITQDRLLGIYDKKNELPKNSFLLTFDDGYADHIENVLSVLEEYKMTGVFFLPIKGIVERELLVANKIQHVLGTGCDVKKIIEGIFKGVGDFRKRYALKSDDEYWRVYARPGRFDNPEVKFVKSMLQSALPETVRGGILDNLFEEYVSSDEQAFADELYLSVSDVEELRVKGMEIASHGYEHVRWELLSEEEQKEDTRKAVTQFGKLGIDESNWTMCYPYGSYSKGMEDVLGGFGCRAGYMTKGGATRIDKTNRFEINRMDVNELQTEMIEQRLGLGQA